MRERNIINIFKTEVVPISIQKKDEPGKVAIGKKTVVSRVLTVMSSVR